MNAENNTQGKNQQDSTNEPTTKGLGRLLVAYLVVTVLVAIATVLIWDIPTLWVALLSAGACCLSAVLGHFASIFPRGELFRLTRLYQSMAARVILPFALLFVCKTQFPEVFSRGMVYFVFLFYLVGLMTEVLVQAQQLKVLKPVKDPAMGKAASGESQAG